MPTPETTSVEASRIMDYYPKIYFACHTRHVTDKDTGVKLTANQASVLDHLDPHEPVTLYDLAMHMGVTPSTMSIAIDRLAKFGYVKRERDKKDARKTNLSLTPEGQKLKKSHSVLDPSLLQAVLDRLSPTERKLAVDGMGLLAFAAEMELKSRSLAKSWNRRGAE
jgi:MarR family transcriptional regulator, organic hydroperoxide resistance regulator